MPKQPNSTASHNQTKRPGVFLIYSYVSPLGNSANGPDKSFSISPDKSDSAGDPIRTQQDISFYPLIRALDIHRQTEFHESGTRQLHAHQLPTICQAKSAGVADAKEVSSYFVSQVAVVWRG